MPKIGSPRNKILDLIMKSVNKHPDGCWFWEGAKVSGPHQKGKPYGVIPFRGKFVLVRRVIYELFNRQPPLEDRCVDSTCNNSLCVCPEHLVRSQRKKSNGPTTRRGVEGGARHPRFPWESWFKKSRLRLVRGKDYTCKPHCMAQMVRSRAKLFDSQVSIQIAEDGQIDVTIYKEGE